MRASPFTSTQFSGADQLQMPELLTKLTYQEKDYLRAASWLRRYAQAGASDAMRLKYNTSTNMSSKAATRP